MPFTLKDIPSQRGRLAVITGATGGLGYETALGLAGAGATVVLTGRNGDKGARALAAIRQAVPDADISYEALDLSSLALVSDFAVEFARRHDRLDLLVNNAGVMAVPTRQVTGDGFELQFQTDYLGHFALTARLLPLLAAARGARVVNLSSGYANMGRIHLDDLQLANGYRPYRAYAQAKLAMLMFSLELQRRSDRSGWNVVATAAHPGYARTDLIDNGPGRRGIGGLVIGLITPVMSQSASAGALPTLYAATSPAAQPAGYYGPDGLLELTGAPHPARIPPQALDTAVAARLWTASEGLAGVRFPALAVPA